MLAFATNHLMNGYGMYSGPTFRSPNWGAYEVALVGETLEANFVEEKPKRLTGGRAYDSDPLEARLEVEGIEMIAPHRKNRKKPK